MELSPIEAALQSGDIENKLFEDSTEKELITDLQRVLFELGFKQELKWDNYEADGLYGPATVKAVQSFAQKNKKASNGKKVTKTLARLMLSRHEFLPSMYILWAIHQSDLRKRKYISKGTRVSISAVQTLLNELGYGEQLKFAKFGADGLYGNNTQKAVIAYAKKNGIDNSDGDLLSRPLINAMMKDINSFYGKNWSELADNYLPGGNSPLIRYDGSRFIGKACLADIKFKPMLEKINDYAESAEVFIYVTSSFRTSTNVAGAIVTPAKFSNHMAGHGIDMNVIYENDKWANSSVLIKYPNVPEPVKKFLKSIIDDPDLRWGGLFNKKDPVHIDDGLNRDMNAWKKRYMAMQLAVQLGDN